MPVLPLERTAYHIPEVDTPRDFGTQGIWGVARFLMRACIKYSAYLGAGEGPRRRKENTSNAACAFKKVY